MKLIIQKTLIMFRGRAVCAKCVHLYYVPQPVRHKTNGMSAICYRSHWQLWTGEEFWIPLDEINPDGKCTAYQKKHVVKHGDNHCIYCTHKDEAFGENICNAFDMLVWIHNKYAKCSRKNKYSTCRQYSEKEIIV